MCSAKSRVAVGLQRTWPKSHVGACLVDALAAVFAELLHILHISLRVHPAMSHIAFAGAHDGERQPVTLLFAYKQAVDSMPAMAVP